AAAAGAGGAVGAGLGAAAAAGAGAAGAATAPLASAAGATTEASAPPSLRNREGASSGMVNSGCRDLARASSTPCVSGLAGSGTQQSTGHTAAQASWSWKPTHSVHLDGTM